MEPMITEPVAPGLLNCTSIIRLTKVMNAVAPIIENTVFMMLYMRILFFKRRITAFVNSIFEKPEGSN